jgi:ATP-dependent helicase/nuclease subunit B
MVMRDLPAHVFSIVPGAPFIQTLADAIISKRLIRDWPDSEAPLSLSEATLYLPTRRAARALVERLQTMASGKTMLLPKILPLGGLEEMEERRLLDSGVDALLGETDLLPDINPVRRRLVLARLVMQWSNAITASLSEGRSDLPFARSLIDGLREDPDGFVVASSPRDALQLADALGSLIDTLVIHGKTWHDIHALVPQDLADDYWKISRDFLEIAARHWPQFLQEHGVLDAAEKRHRLIKNEADRLRRERPEGVVIAAGSTGSMPATADLLSAIAHLPRGAVILPGYDPHIDAADLAMVADHKGHLIEPQHPQALMHSLVTQMGVSRETIMMLGTPKDSIEKRMRFLTEAMRPVASTHDWRTRSTRIDDEAVSHGLKDVTVIEAAHEREEALAIALILREALETPHKTAALITPDRTLAERVQSDLKRWNIRVEDSAGMALSRSSAGRLAMRLAEAVADDFSPWPLLALLRHPSVRFGLDDNSYASAVTAIDIGVLRALHVPRGLDAIAKICQARRGAQHDKYAPVPEKRLTDAHWQAASHLIEKMQSACAAMLSSSSHDLVARLSSLEDVLRAAVARPDNPDKWDQESGASDFAALCESVPASEAWTLNGHQRDFPGFLEVLMHGVMVRDPRPGHPRIAIWGLLEARLLPVDRVVLAGLDESVWPPDARTDPFLNRPWRDALQLPAPERRIGQTAHDLTSAMGTHEVFLTRSLKRGGAPTVASRFLQRMQAVAGEKLFAPVMTRGQVWIDYARRFDKALVTQPIKRPAPSPPSDLLPRQLSVTKIETLRRDPYSIYARSVLHLDPLQPIARGVTAADFGNAVHDALETFRGADAYGSLEAAHEALLEAGQQAFQPLCHAPEYRAFWWPRFEAIAKWLLEWDVKRRAAAQLVLTEETAALTFPLPSGGEFTLTARADRLERIGDGVAVIDYKTGSPPSLKQVELGFSPQLTLEAALAKRGAFKGIDARATEQLLYVKFGRDGGEEKFIKPKDRALDEMVEDHFAQLVQLIDAHWNKGRGFASRPFAEYAKAYADYDHLARVKEWSVAGDDSDSGESFDA